MSALSGLIVAVFAVSWASIFIRWCGDTPALVISFYRMLWSAFLFFLFLVVKKPSALKYKQIGGRSLSYMLVAGVFLALHFGTWIASIQLTTISHSLILESTHPVFALILSALFLKERGGWKTFTAAIVTFAGIMIIGGQDLTAGNSKFTGDLLALAGAIFVSLYILIARHQRAKIDLIPYLVAVYTVAAISLLILILMAGYPLIHYPWRVHLMMILLAVVPTGIGHSLINWAARKIEIYKVNFSILGEPVIASFMAYFIFGEKPYGLFYVGATFIVLGILMALSDKPSKTAESP